MEVRRREKRNLAWSEPGFSRGMYNTIATFFPPLVRLQRTPNCPSSLSFPLSHFLLPLCLKTVSPSLLPSAPSLPPSLSPVHISDFNRGMANTMVSVRSSELGPLGWDAVTKRRLFLQKVSSKLGPSARQQGRGVRLDKGPSGLAIPLGSGTGLPGQGSPGPRQAQSDGSTLREDGQSAGLGSPTRARQSQTLSQGESIWFLYVCRDINMSYFRTDTFTS